MGQRLEAEYRVDQILRNISGGFAVYRIGAAVETLLFTDGLATMLGFTRGEYEALVRRDALDGVYALDQKLLRDRMTQCAQAKEDINHTYRACCKDGRPTRVQLSASYAGEEEDGSPLYHATFR